MSQDADFKPFAPNGKPHYNPDRPGKVEHIFLDLKIDFDDEIVTGLSKISLNPLRNGIETLELNAIEMEIKGVKVDGEEIKFEYDGNKIFLYLNNSTEIGKRLLIETEYKLEKPKMGMTFIKPSEYYPNKPKQLWTQGESEQSRYWYPCFDYPLQICTSEIKVEVPKEFATLSNGELINKEIKENTRVDHWQQNLPHPNYLIMLTAGEFVEIKDKYGDLPVNYYVQKGMEEMLQLSAQKTPQMMEFYSKKFGVPYPWAKYSQAWVHDYIWGGMENTTATLNTERALVDKRASLDYTFSELLIAHELTHQWFGDYIVIDHWSHLWIKEGAATYGEYLWIEHEYGKDEFQYYKLQETREYLDEDGNQYRRPVVTNIFKDAEDVYDRHSYSKGGLIYNMIRTELGDELFETVLKQFLTENKHKNVDTWKILNIIEEVTGRNLKPLFDQYIFRGGHPDFKVGFSWDNDSKLGKLTVTQKQAENDKDIKNLFDLKIPVVFGTVEKEEVSLINLKLHINQKEQNFYFPLEKKPDFISFDADNNYIKTVELDFDINELKNQLKYDPDPISRIFAAEALSKKGNLEAVKAMQEALKNEKFWAVRSEIVQLLGNIQLEQSVEALLEGLEDTDTKVRKSTINSLVNFKTHETFEATYQIASQGDVSYFTEAAALKAVGAIAYHLKGEYISRSIKLFESVLVNKAGWNEVVRSGAINGLSKLKSSEEALEIIINYTKLGISQFLRLAAISALGQISKGQKKENIDRILEILKENSKYSYIMSERAVISALSEIESSRVIPILQGIAGKTIYGRMKNYAEEAIRKVCTNIGPTKSINKLREEVNEIKKENQKLRSKIEAIEAKNKPK